MDEDNTLILQQNVDLSKFSGIRVGGKSAWHVSIGNELQIPKLAVEIKSNNNLKGLKIVPVGSGTNTFFGSGKLNILSIENNLLGKEVIINNGDEVQVKIASGENWDETVNWAVNNHWSGIEALSAIPGTVGAAPVQNIGAYGAELSEVIETVRVYDFRTGLFKELNNNQCNFSYRNSIFRENPNRYFIAHVVMRLKNNNLVDTPCYSSIADKFDGSKVPIKTVRKVVTETRWSKLPQPDVLPNCGSWFKNPILDNENYNVFLQKLNNFGIQLQDVSKWDLNDGKIKIAAGWLVEHAVGKDFCDKYFCTYPKNALVIINPTLSPSTKKLLKFEKVITDAVFEKFGIQLEREPVLIE